MLLWPPAFFWPGEPTQNQILLPLALPLYRPQMLAARPEQSLASWNSFMGPNLQLPGLHSSNPGGEAPRALPFWMLRLPSGSPEGEAHTLIN